MLGPVTSWRIPRLLSRTSASALRNQARSLVKTRKLPLAVKRCCNRPRRASSQYPRREEIYRGDYNINDKWRAYGRYIRNKDETSMAYGQWNASYNIPFGPMSFGAPGWSFVANVTTIINPTLTNEFVFGSSRNDLRGALAAFRETVERYPQGNKVPDGVSEAISLMCLPPDERHDRVLDFCGSITRIDRD